MDKRRVGATSVSVTSFGFGGTGIGSMYRPVAEVDAREALASAWNHGVRYFDTAPMYGYGQSERRLGDFLRDKPEDSYVISSKVGRLLVPGSRDLDTDPFKSNMPFRAVFDYSYDAAMRSYEASLHRLGLGSIDIMFIHDIGADTHGSERQPAVYREAVEGAYRALASLKADGQIKAIGIGVNETTVCLDMLRDTDIDCILLAGRYTLLEQEPLQSLFPACERKQVSIFLGGVFNSGILINPDAKRPTYNYLEAPSDIVDRARAIDSVGRSHGIALAAAALAMPLRQSAVACVLSGASSATEMEQIAQWTGSSIPAAYWRDLKSRDLLDQAA